MKKLLSTKKALMTAAVGLAFFAANSFAAPVTVCPGTSKDKSSADFVYCGPATCTANSDGKTATCNDCYHMTGQNLGTTSCEDRAPTAQGVYTSSFSMRKALLNGKKEQPVIVCDPAEGADNVYADCLNSLCTVTDSKTGLATCQCNLVQMSKGKTFITQTRSCDAPNKCNAPSGTVLNGAPTTLVAPMLELITHKTSKSMSDLTCSSSSRYFAGENSKKRAPARR